MFRVWVCAAHMGGFLGRNSLNKGPFFQQIFHKHGLVIQKLAKTSQNGPFSAKIKAGLKFKFW